MAKTLDEAGVKRLIQEIKGANKNLNAPIPISTENTAESMAQNVKNIADYVEKAKAAGVDTTKSFRITLEIDGYPVEGSYDIQYSYACGLQITDDGYALLYNIDVTTGEVFTPCEIVTARSIQKVTSDMLAKGARKPIIITGDMTEVDEETYQKLLSDDVDVVFKDDTNFRIISLTSKIVNDIDEFLRLEFCQAIQDSETFDDACFIRVYVSIKKSLPHTTTISNNTYFLTESLDNSGYLNKFILSPVLQEIDLTGTDADRKAKLDQFKTDWKTLTGANDILGARFVGNMGTINGALSTIFAWNSTSSFYEGVGTDDVEKIYKIQVDPSDGNIYFTPLFSHLEAITIRTGNTTEAKAANVAAINAYVDNLKLLGVDTTKGYMIPAKLDSGSLDGFVSYHSDTADYPWSGVFIRPGGSGKFGAINKDGLVVLIDDILISANIYTTLTTTSKGIIPAINEINANAVHSDKLVPTLEAITIKTGNTPEDKAANVAAIKAYVDNLKALGVDTTKGYMIPFRRYNSIAYGILVGSGENPRLQGYMNSDYTTEAIFINPDGTVNEISLQSRADAGLETNSKVIIKAINEVNALAKGYSTPIELTTETAQNKTAIDARVAAFTAKGISLTNGCCIPVTYKGVYAGNISLINGDWYGLLVKNTNNPADNINIKLSADGTITEGNSAQ